MSDLLNNIVFDYSLEGKINTKGLIDTVYNRNALESSIKNFLFMQKGEIIEKENIYSPLISLLEKPMSDFKQQQIENLLWIALDTEFQPKLQINNIEASPDYENKTWNIRIEGYCIDLGINFLVDEIVKNLS